MKKLILGFLILVVNNTYAAEEQWINSTGSGATYEEAKNIALRNALELAFGTFISSNTVIRNDILEKDEIVSISSGTIKKYNEISKMVINGMYCVSLNVLVSPEKLATLVQSKGMVVDFQGESFASNIKIQMMNEKAEAQSIQILVDYSKIVLERCFEYEVDLSEPKEYMDNAWEIHLTLSVNTNKNFNNLVSHLQKTLGSISLNQKDIETRLKMGKNPILFKIVEDRTESVFVLRDLQSKSVLVDLFKNELINSIQSVKIIADAGKYTRYFENQLKFQNNAFGLHLQDYNGKPWINFRATEGNDYDSGYKMGEVRFAKLSPSSNFATYVYTFNVKGDYWEGGTLDPVDVISKLKGFMVIK